MIRQISYSSRYFPPVPVLHIRLRVPDTARTHGPVWAIIDTGADMTIVPLAWLEGIAAPELDEVSSAVIGEKICARSHTW